MGQLVLPLLPAGCTMITDVLSVNNESGTWTYFHGGLPVFSHDAEDIRSFQMITAQFAVTGACRQADIHRAFGVSLISLKRKAQLYRTGGCAAFFKSRRGRGPGVLTPDKVEQLQTLLDSGMSYKDAAHQAGVHADTVRKGIGRGLLRELKKTKPSSSRTPVIRAGEA